MEQQNFNSENGDFVRTDGSIVAGESEKIKKLFKGLAVLVVFLSSLFMPLCLSYKAQEKAKEMRVKMDMSQLRNWAEVYELNNQDYAGLENDLEIQRVFKSIESMGGVASIFVSSDSKKYCSQANFSNKKLGTWCVDDSGNVQAGERCEGVRCE
jgi:hypothetical protein